MKRLAEAGYFISFTPDLLYEPEIEAIARYYPLDLIMAETDGPWPFEGPFARLRTTPLWVEHVIRRLAEIKGVKRERVERMLLEQACAFFGPTSSA